MLQISMTKENGSSGYGAAVSLSQPVLTLDSFLTFALFPPDML
jgi:hypothetical protein